MIEYNNPQLNWSKLNQIERKEIIGLVDVAMNNPSNRTALKATIDKIKSIATEANARPDKPSDFFAKFSRWVQNIFVRVPSATVITRVNELQNIEKVYVDEDKEQEIKLDQHNKTIKKNSLILL